MPETAQRSTAAVDAIAVPPGAIRLGMSKTPWVGYRPMVDKSDAIFIVIVALVCGLSVFIGVATPLGSYGHDTLFLLDTANRVLQGQVPHRDFSSAWGPVIYLINAAGLAMAGMRPAGIGYANALFGAVVAIWVFLIARSRLSSGIAAIIGIYTVLLITGPFSLGDSALDFGYAMIYNRYGFALSGIIVIECALPVPGPQRRRMGSAISSGIAVGLLAFLKISYAMVALPFLAVSIITAGASYKRRIIDLCAGFALVTVMVMGYLRFDFFDMFEDLSTAATSRRMSLHLTSSIGAIDLIQNIMIIAFCFLIYKTKVDDFDQRVARFRVIITGLLVVAAGYLLLLTNQQTDTFPLNGYAAVALAAVYQSLSAGKSLVLRGFTPGFPGPSLLVACLLPLGLWNGISLAGAALERLSPERPHVLAIESPHRGAYLLFSPVSDGVETETTGADYVGAVNDGLDLLRRHAGANDGVLTLDEFNPFNYLLDRRSPRGGIAAAAYNYIFSDNAHPSPERFFGDARYVMVRKYNTAVDSMERDNVDALWRIYGPALRAHFTLVEETSHWALWGRN